MCEKCSLASEATARLPESVTSMNPLVTPGKAYREVFLFFCAKFFFQMKTLDVLKE